MCFFNAENIRKVDEFCTLRFSEKESTWYYSDSEINMNSNLKLLVHTTYYILLVHTTGSNHIYTWRWAKCLYTKRSSKKNYASGGR